MHFAVNTTIFGDVDLSIVQCCCLVEALESEVYLKEALDNYLDDYVDNDVIRDDILTILGERSEAAYADFNKTSELESKLRKN